MEINDTAIIKKCQKGDLEQFGVLYEKYIKKIYDFVYFKIQHKESTEDTTAKVFMKALAKINDFKVGQGTFQAWLYQIARNAVIDYYRAKKTELNIEDVWGLADTQDCARDLDVKLRLAAVEKYLKKLSAAQRELIIMRVWQDLPYKEIAEITGKSEAACKMAYARAIGQLRTEMPLALFALFCLMRGI